MSASNSDITPQPPTSNSHQPADLHSTPRVSRARQFRSQSLALLLRTYHVQRRQHSINCCTFIVAPLLLIFFAYLSRTLNTREIEPRITDNVDETNPNISFAARPFSASACWESVAENDGDPMICNTPEMLFQPNPYEIPFSAEKGNSKADLGQAEYSECENITTCRRNPSGTGLFRDLSLEPFINPALVNASDQDPCMDAKNTYDCVFRHTVLTPDYLGRLAEGRFNDDQINDIYTSFKRASRDGIVDHLYNTQTKRLDGKRKLLDDIFNNWNRDSLFGKYSSAYFIKDYDFVDNENTEGDEPNELNLDTIVYYNESASANCTRECPLTSSIVQLSQAALKQINPQSSATILLRQYPQISRLANLGFINLIISVFLGLIYHFLFPSFIRLLVYERSTGLRNMMQTMGLTNLNYWVATYLGLLIQYGIYAITLMIIGIAVNISFYRLNTVVSYMVLFFLWGNVMIAFTMVLAPFFKDPEPALVLGWFYVVITTFVGAPFLGRLLASDAPESTWFAVQLLPSFAFLRSVYYMGAFNSGGRGLTIGDEFYGGRNLNMCGDVGPLCQSYIFLVVEWVILILLALYLDKVLPSATGVRAHPLFFLGWKRSFEKKKGKGKDGEIVKESRVGGMGEGADVVAERKNAANMIGNQSVGSGIVIDNLVKVYHSRPPIVAVNKLSLLARPGEVTGILGRNGAGKSSTFKMLTGELEPTSGNVSMNGKSIRTEMNDIRQELGLCPQFDRLWEDMTGEEHLYFYGRMRSLSRSQLKEDVTAALSSVQLLFARKRRVAKYSGGMKRRLSTAISFIGQPPLICLDEPTTGLDVRSRSKVWECIQTFKERGLCIVLTTHSLEEAETLCDRVAIMTNGRLNCVGRPYELKLRLGRGYRLTFSLPESNVPALEHLLRTLCQETTFEASLGDNVIYTLPRSVRLSQIFTEVQANIERLGIRSWDVSQSNLEDVFIDVTSKTTRLEEISDDSVPPV